MSQSHGKTASKAVSPNALNSSTKVAAHASATTKPAVATHSSATTVALCLCGTGKSGYRQDRRRAYKREFQHSIFLFKNTWRGLGAGLIEFAVILINRAVHD